MSDLRERALELATLARLLGSDTTALAALPGMDVDAETLSRRWVRWFELGRIAPYEGSNTAVGSGGITPLLADVAGFYRAFGVAVRQERPDHIVAELEFLALTLTAEADALDDADTDRACTTADATRAFLRDHAGRWLSTWAERVAAVEDLAPWAPIADTAAELVRAECRLRNIVPVAAVPGARETDNDDSGPACGGAA